MKTSRSMVEAYHDCGMLRLLQYHYQGTGTVLKQKSIPLITGTHVHRGVEHLANRVRIGQEPNVEDAVGLAVQEYDKEVVDRGFRGKGVQTDRQQEFTYLEQRALGEALIRVWHLIELPMLLRRYKIIGVERDIVPLRLDEDIDFMAKVDMELQEIATGDYHNYSLKTMKTWNERAENSYKNDLQGITEIWATEEDNTRANKLLAQMQELANMEALTDARRDLLNNLVSIAKFSSTKMRSKKISAVRFCVLLKGQRKLPTYNSNDPNALYITYSPLIRGYKNFTPTSVNYAHSWYYPNPDNKTGKSALGKGWEPFNVWEQTDINIKSWIEFLATGQCQPECGDVLKEQVISPPEYYRDENEMLRAMMEVIYQERRVNEGLYKLGKSDDEGHTRRVLAEYFPHKRNHCWFHFGETCPYIEHPMCWGSDDKLELFEIRQPHHEREKE